MKVQKEYTLQTAQGPRTLAELFDGRSQLVIYHFMFGPDWQAGCPVCSSIADSFNGVLAHLNARDTTMICVSRAPIDQLVAYRQRMEWGFTWASSFDSDFNRDLRHVASQEEAQAWADHVPPLVSTFASGCGTDVVGYLMERPGLTVFARDADDVYLTYTSTARGLEVVMTYYEILDRVPLGRNEHEPEFQSWIRRHDEYTSAARA